MKETKEETTQSTEFDILKLVCYRLEQTEIHYMLTGSFALNFYATPRMTRDIDIVIEIDKNDVNRLIYLFQDDFYIDKDQIDDAIKYENLFNIVHNSSVIKIDFVVCKKTLYRTIEFKRRQKVQWGNTFIWIVAPEDLILSKLYWAKDSLSEMQLNDIRNLLNCVKDLDVQYIEQWVRGLNLSHIFEKVKTHA